MSWFSQIKGKTILVIGGASGIGLASAICFAEAGGVVTVADLHESEAVKDSTEVAFTRCDVTNWGDLLAAFEFAKRDTENLDVVINSAGVNNHANMIQLVKDAPSDIPPVEPNLDTLDINLKGTYYICWLALWHFRKNQSPSSLVIVSSLVAYGQGPGGTTQYFASKWGMRGMYQTLKGKTGEFGTRFNMVNPFWVRTKLRSAERRLKAGAESWAEMDDVVEAIGRCAFDPDLDGRSFSVWPRPRGIEEMDDTPSGAFAGPQMVTADLS